MTPHPTWNISVCILINITKHIKLRKSEKFSEFRRSSTKQSSTKIEKEFWTQNKEFELFANCTKIPNSWRDFPVPFRLLSNCWLFWAEIFQVQSKMNNFLDFFHFMDKKGKVCATLALNSELCNRNCHLRHLIFRLSDPRSDSPMARYDIRSTNKRKRVYSRESTWGRLWDYRQARIWTIGWLFMLWTSSIELI